MTSRFQEYLTSRGQPIPGRRDGHRALSLQDTLRALAMLAEEGRLLRGIDVFAMKNGQLESAHGGWSVQGRAGESREAAQARNLAEAEQYVSETAHWQAKEDYYFLVVTNPGVE